MNDYLNLLKEYEEIDSYYKSIKSDYDFFEIYINQFINAISLLDYAKIKDELIKEKYILLFKEKYGDLVKKTNEIINIDNIDLIAPLKQVCESQNNQMKKILECYKKIKNNLFEGKLKLTNAKKEYLEILNEKNQIKDLENDNNINSESSSKNEDNDLYEAKKNNSFILYKYQLEKHNEKIEKSNKKYNEIKPEIDSMHFERENTYKVIILKFAKMIGDIGNIFIEFQKNIQEKFLKVLNENTQTSQYYNSENALIKERFPKETLQTKEDMESIYQEKKKKNDNIQNDENIIEENPNEDNNKNKIEKLKSLDGLDFEIMNEPIYSEDPVLISLINEVIQKLLDEKEISSSDISQLLDNIKSDTDCSFKFLEELKKHCKNNFINLKNEKNFIHLSNLFNQLFLIKDNNNELIVQILEFSQKIKYNNQYISSMIRQKNKIIRSQKFWINLIENDLIYNITVYINELINDKSKEIKNQKYSNTKISEKLLNILNNIIIYKKLNKKQKNQAEEYAKEIILKIISKSITIMSNFLLPQQLIMDIFNHYVEQFEFGIETYYYFENISLIKFKKSYLKMNSSDEHSKEKYGLFLNNEQLIILNAAKFLPKNDYIKIFQVNKLMYSKIRKYLMHYRLLYLNISLDERIQIWEIILNIKELRKKYDYNLIKNNYMDKMSIKNFYGTEKKRFLNIIDLDLARTPLFNTQETHKIKANFILKCCATLEPEINYYQGMNYILLFIYQVLNYDEEKTFYLFWALLKETKFTEIFNDDMKNLVIYFKVFEKIIESNYPDIYYSLENSQIMTQFYATQWFVTFFSTDAEEFDRKKIPKLLCMAFESYLFSRWVGLLNLGLALCLYNKDKILNLTGSSLLKFMIKELNSIKNIGEENLPIIRKIFMNNSEKIDETYFQKLINVVNFEEDHPFFKKKYK